VQTGVEANSPAHGRTDPAAHSRDPAKGRRRLLLVAVLGFGLVIATATSLLFVWPRRDGLSHVDAIVVFNGNGEREAKAIALAQRGLAPMLVFSEADPPREPVCRLALRLDDRKFDPLQPEALKVVEAGTRITCFRPSTATTQGESEAVARLADTYGWHRIMLVVSRPQASRARVRLRRCYAGQFLVQTVPIRRKAMPWTVAYEWGAMVKALVLQRNC